MTTKRATSFRLSPEAEAVLDLEAATLGVARTAVVELALRELFDRNQARRAALRAETEALAGAVDGASFAGLVALAEAVRQG